MKVSPPKTDKIKKLRLTTKADDKKINLGDNPTHTAFVVDDYDAALELHKSMNCVDFIHADGMHFLKDPDGYSLEIMSKNFLESISAED